MIFNKKMKKNNKNEEKTYLFYAKIWSIIQFLLLLQRKT